MPSKSSVTVVFWLMCVVLLFLLNTGLQKNGAGVQVACRRQISTGITMLLCKPEAYVRAWYASPL